MNPIRFIIACAVIGFLFPIFRHMIADCWERGNRQSSGPVGSAIDRVFQWFLGTMLGLVFMALVFGLLVFGTLPAGKL